MLQLCVNHRRESDLRLTAVNLSLQLKTMGPNFGYMTVWETTLVVLRGSRMLAVIVQGQASPDARIHGMADGAVLQFFQPDLLSHAAPVYSPA